MKVNMTHDDNIKIFNDTEHHLILEDEQREAAKFLESKAYMVETSRTRGSKIKGKRSKKKGGGKENNGPKEKHS